MSEEKWKTGITDIGSEEKDIKPKLLEIIYK